MTHDNTLNRHASHSVFITRTARMTGEKPTAIKLETVTPTGSGNRNTPDRMGEKPRPTWKNWGR